MADMTFDEVKELLDAKVPPASALRNWIREKAWQKSYPLASTWEPLAKVPILPLRWFEGIAEPVHPVCTCGKNGDDPEHIKCDWRWVVLVAQEQLVSVPPGPLPRPPSRVRP